MIRNGFRQPKKTEIKKQQQAYSKALHSTIGKEYILLAEGVISWGMKLTKDYLSLDVGFIPEIMKLFKEIEKLGNNLLESTKDEIECIPLEYASLITKNKLREYAASLSENSKDNKYNAVELGIEEKDYLYFQQIDICYDVLNKELCKNSKFTAKQTECLKMFRRCCKKLVKFFNSEVISDMKNRGLAV
jgi:hypothetical protein